MGQAWQMTIGQYNKFRILPNTMLTAAQFLKILQQAIIKSAEQFNKWRCGEMFFVFKVEKYIFILFILANNTSLAHILELLRNIQCQLEHCELQWVIL